METLGEFWKEATAVAGAAVAAGVAWFSKQDRKTQVLVGFGAGFGLLLLISLIAG